MPSTQSALRFSSHAWLAVLLGALVACGGGTLREDGHACPPLDPGAGAEALEIAASCYQALGDSGASACRSAIEWAEDASPKALRTIAQCVLQSNERSDGVWLADLFYQVDGNRELILAIATVFGDSFNPARHGVTFTSSVLEDSQHALGQALDDMSASSREALVALALAYSLSPLSSYAVSFTHELQPDDPVVQVYVEQLAEASTPLAPVEQQILVETGAWSAQDAIDCFEGRNSRCQEGQRGLSLAALSTLAAFNVGLPSTPNAAIRLLRSQTLEPASARGLAALVGGATYPDRDTLIRSMMLDMTDANFRPEIRAAIADAATPAMCQMSIVSSLLLRVQASDPDRLENAETPWAHFVRNCAERHWGANELMFMVSSGSWAGVPEAIWNELFEKLLTLTSGESCDQLQARSEASYTAERWVLPRGTARVVASRLGGETCESSLTRPVKDMARSRSEHPEARLAGFLRLLELGDRTGCGQERELLRWRHPDYGTGPGPWAEAFGNQLRNSCR